MIDAIMREDKQENFPIKKTNSFMLPPKTSVDNPPRLNKTNLSSDNRILNENKIVLATAVENMLIK